MNSFPKSGSTYSINVNHPEYESVFASTTIPDSIGLIDFEYKVKDKYEKGEIKGPVHLAGNNEEELIEL